ncbi:MAG: hypothetical protein JWO76_237 [Nocardioides sp.]|nr:hypothetical protein [Nocardioides sp.]
MLRVWSVATVRGRLTALVGALAAAGGLVWHYPVLAGLGGALLLVVGVEVASVLLSGAVTVRREVSPSVVVRHDPCSGTLHVTGQRRRGFVRVDASDVVDGKILPVQLPEGVRGRTVSVSYSIPTPRRGLLDIGPVRLRRYGITGMATASIEVGEIGQVRVLPRRVPVAAMMPGDRRAAAGGSDSMDYGGTDLVGLHEYAMGDDLRRLHWATSARTGTLMVREDADPSEPHVLVLLDDRLMSYSDVGGPGDSFEEAVELVAALCRVTVDQGNPLRFRTVSGRDDIVVPGSPTRQPRHEAQDLDWFLAEVGQTSYRGLPPFEPQGHDVVVAVTGATADERELMLLVGSCPTGVLAVVDPVPLVSAEQRAGVLVLRGAGSLSLAASWDEAATR